jgi:hypothetical protein
LKPPAWYVIALSGLHPVKTPPPFASISHKGVWFLANFFSCYSVVNTVLATDIMDKDLKALRNARWEKAFNKDAAQQPGSAKFVSVAEDTNRKATIVIEHLIQASDVAHTMQHWEVYTKVCMCMCMSCVT